MVIEDAAKRISDAVNLAALAGDIGKWMAFRLNTGTTDHTLYDSRAAAVEKQLWPEHMCFIQVMPGGMQPKEAQAYLLYWRALHDNGGRFRDADFTMPPMPLIKTDQIRQIQKLIRGR
jgi:hypothetical protein